MWWWCAPWGITPQKRSPSITGCLTHSQSLSQAWTPRWGSVLSQMLRLQCLYFSLADRTCLNTSFLLFVITSEAARTPRVFIILAVRFNCLHSSNWRAVIVGYKAEGRREEGREGLDSSQLSINPTLSFCPQCHRHQWSGTGAAVCFCSSELQKDGKVASFIRAQLQNPSGDPSVRQGWRKISSRLSVCVVDLRAAGVHVLGSDIKSPR